MRRTLGFSNRDGKIGNTFVSKMLSPENIWAFLLFLIIIALIIFTTDDSPIWIYQGF